MEAQIRCKECGAIWPHNELKERNADGWYICPKCNASLYNSPIVNEREWIDDKPDPFDDFLADMERISRGCDDEIAALRKAAYDSHYLGHYLAEW